VRWYGIDAQIVQQAAELGGLPFPRQLLLQGFLLSGWCLKDAVAVPVDGQGYTMGGYYVLQQFEVTLGILLWAEEGIRHLTGSIIYGPYQAELWSPAL
jgi:hypothetical protein